MDGQISIFDILTERKINEKNECLGEPCMYCDVECGSIICFIRRGYVWDRVNRFAKDDRGKHIRKQIESRECKKVYENET